MIEPKHDYVHNNVRAHYEVVHEDCQAITLQIAVQVFPAYSIYTY